MFDVSRLQFVLESGFYFGRVTDKTANYVSVLSSECVQVNPGLVTITALGEQGVLEEKSGWTPLEVTLKLAVEVTHTHEGDECLIIKTAERCEDLFGILVIADNQPQTGGRLQIGRAGQFGVVLTGTCPDFSNACAMFTPQ